MRETVRTRPQLAADLGCGPGYTTHLLADTLKPERTVGLDNSENFLSHVRTTASDNVSFRLHDITTAPFPEAPFDLIFSRLVLTHLQDPMAAIDLWTDQLRPGGLLLLEEVERIYTKVPALVTYLDIQQAMLDTAKQRALHRPPPRRSNRIRQAAPPFQQRDNPPSTRRPRSSHVPHEPRRLATQRLCTANLRPLNPRRLGTRPPNHRPRPHKLTPCRMATPPNRHRTLRPVDQRLTAPTPPRHSRESGNPSLFLHLSTSSALSAVNLPLTSRTPLRHRPHPARSEPSPQGTLSQSPYSHEPSPHPRPPPHHTNRKSCP